MTDFFKLIENKQIEIPENMRELLKECKSLTVFDTTEESAEAATGGKNNISFDVKYDVPGKGEYVEAVVHKVKNGISANYTDTYMRRRDPNTMVIGDDKPTGKTRFQDRFGYPFADVQKETFEWMKKQDLALFFYFAGRDNMGIGGLAIAPANAAFFCMGLSMLQKTISTKDLDKNFKVESVIVVTQAFHLPRAIFICSALGLQSEGVTADDANYPLRSYTFWWTREIIATIKAYWDVYIIPPTLILGDPEPIFP